MFSKPKKQLHRDKMAGLKLSPVRDLDSIYTEVTLSHDQVLFYHHDLNNEDKEDNVDDPTPHVVLLDLEEREPVEIVPYDGSSHGVSSWTPSGDAVLYENDLPGHYP